MTGQLDLKGLKIGRLAVLSKANKKGFRKVIWRCLCDCGAITEVPSSRLSSAMRNPNSGGTKSCGCLNREPRIHNYTHGHRRGGKASPTYDIWANMLQRCSNAKTSGFHRYGGRGIKVCERWKDYRNFLEDMGEKPDGLTIDRIDNDGNYEPSNCRWATRKENSRNSTNTKLTIGRVQRIKKLLKNTDRTLKEIAGLYGISRNHVSAIKTNRLWEDVEI